MAGPLSGVKVLELTSVVMGPYACQTLADMGAEVIKVEPPQGDTNRNLGASRTNKDMAALFLTCNRNKRDIVLDLKSDEGKEACLKLAAEADVIIHNFRPQAMERLGLTYERIKEVNPTIIYCACYGYSKKGPYGNKGALDDSIQSASGIAHLNAMVYGEPRYMPTVIADKTTGLTAVYAITSALYAREKIGKGQEIEVPMFETMVAFTMAEHMWGQTFEPPIGNAGYTRIMSLNRKPYKTKDGYIAVLPYFDAHWATFCKLAEVPELIEDERFTTMAERLKNIDQTYEETGKALLAKTTEEWMDLLGDTNVPTIRVNTLDGLIDDPHLKATNFFEHHEHPTEGTLKLTKFPVNFSETPADIRRLPPRLGEHSVEILKEVGYSDEEIQSMIDAGQTKQADV
jgi:crotonobetainyl-CoA:carnitine CoA-transferase CaiB-like acyl-CoA transferase